MRFLLDTNTLFYAANGDSPHNAVVRTFLEQRFAEGSPWCLTWGVIYEFLRLATHPRILRSPQSGTEAYRFIESLTERHSVTILTATSRHSDLLRVTIRDLARPAGNLFHDIETAVLAREHGVPEIITTDSDFLRFRFLRVTNPLLDPA